MATRKTKKKAAVKPAKKKTVKPASKIQRKVITEKDVSLLSYNVELSRGEMAIIVNALNLFKDSSTFRMLPTAYKSKHNKLLNIFEDEIHKKRTR